MNVVMDTYGIRVIFEVPKPEENPMGTTTVLAHSGHPSFWWSNGARGMEAPVFPRFLQIYTRRVLDSEYILGGKNSRITFEKAVFGPLWPNAPRRPRLDGLPSRTIFEQVRAKPPVGMVISQRGGQTAKAGRWPTRI
jgi:hypothetical protein